MTLLSEIETIDDGPRLHWVLVFNDRAIATLTHTEHNPVA